MASSPLRLGASWTERWPRQSDGSSAGCPTLLAQIPSRLAYYGPVAQMTTLLLLQLLDYYTRLSRKATGRWYSLNPALPGAADRAAFRGARLRHHALPERAPDEVRLHVQPELLPHFVEPCDETGRRHRRDGLIARVAVPANFLVLTADRPLEVDALRGEDGVEVERPQGQLDLRATAARVHGHAGVPNTIPGLVGAAAGTGPAGRRSCR